jgi:hypothetical protein
VLSNPALACPTLAWHSSGSSISEWVDGLFLHCFPFIFVNEAIPVEIQRAKKLFALRFRSQLSLQFMQHLPQFFDVDFAVVVEVAFVKQDLLKRPQSRAKMAAARRLAGRAD